MREPSFSIRHTIITTLVIATICATLVVATSNLLKPRQLAWLAVEMNRSIVTALDPSLDHETLTAAEVVERFAELEIMMLDIRSGSRTDALDPRQYNVFSATDQAELRYEIPAAMDTAGLVQRPTLAPVYGLYDGSTLQRIGLPVYGPGMWSTISGFIVLQGDYNTVANLQIYQHGETPGIGDQIESHEWRRQWIGKKVRNEDGEMKLRQRKTTQGGENEEHEIDAISGATVTSSSVISFVQYWLGDDGYGPFLVSQQKEAAR